jgi:predicted metalloendopeptidase
MKPKQERWKKLNAFAKKIAYPDKWKDYAGVVINRNDYLGNARRASQYAYNDMITRCTHIVNMEACTRHLIFSQAIKCM